MFSSNLDLRTVTPSGAGGNWASEDWIKAVATTTAEKDFHILSTMLKLWPASDSRKRDCKIFLARHLGEYEQSLYVINSDFPRSC